ncbi:MAG TPA: type II toxin-antitoxin system VapC family toxin [Candidatus Bathyarchaeia archaeon]|nr:type II toxin-antitoxin system VapC family toxin [Candidatus Bathyarchaeia archaeon]
MLIDSYGWIEYFIEGPLAEKYAPYVLNANENSVVTPTIVVYEVYKRLKAEKGEEVALEAYAQITRTKIVPLDQNSALRAADVSLTEGLAMADAIVYSTAKAYAAELVTSDNHLKRLKGIRFIQ